MGAVLCNDSTRAYRHDHRFVWLMFQEKRNFLCQEATQKGTVIAISDRCVWTVGSCVTWDSCNDAYIHPHSKNLKNTRHYGYGHPNSVCQGSLGPTFITSALTLHWRPNFVCWEGLFWATVWTVPSVKMACCKQRFSFDIRLQLQPLPDNSFQWG